MKKMEECNMLNIATNYIIVIMNKLKHVNNNVYFMLIQV